MQNELEKIVETVINNSKSTVGQKSKIVLDAVLEIKSAYGRIVNSLKEANEQNSNLLKEKFKLENDIIELKKTIYSYIKTNDNIVETNLTCLKNRDFENCDIWEKSIKGCGDCKFLKLIS